MVEQSDLERLANIRIELTSIYVNLPVETQKRLGLRADSVLSEEIIALIEEAKL